jgi:hypothetical protein
MILMMVVSVCVLVAILLTNLLGRTRDGMLELICITPRSCETLIRAIAGCLCGV